MKFYIQMWVCVTYPRRHHTELLANVQLVSLLVTVSLISGYTNFVQMDLAPARSNYDYSSRILEWEGMSLVLYGTVTLT